MGNTTSYEYILEADSDSRLRDLECYWCLVEYNRHTSADYLAPQPESDPDPDGNEIAYYRYVPVCEGCLGDWYADVLHDKQMPIIKIDWTI